MKAIILHQVSPIPEETQGRFNIHGLKEPSMSSHNYSHLIFDPQNAKKYTLEERQNTQQVVCQNPHIEK